MRLYFLVRVVLHLIAGLLTCALVFPFTDDVGKQTRIRGWSARLLKLCGVTVNVRRDRPDAAPALVIANHVSWLDIFVINSIEPCRFVAKSDVRDWPLIGWLCERAGTIFIARGRPRDVRHIYQGLVESIHNGERVAFFPEGTTSTQGTVLPFHANLFEAAIEAEVPIQPYALRYTNYGGAFHPGADFVGETTFVQSILAVLAVRDFHAEVTVVVPIPAHGLHRRELAAQSRAAIARTLDSGCSNSSRAADIAGN